MRYAVITTHDRHEMLDALLESIPDDVTVIIVDNASNPPVSIEGVTVIRYDAQPPNLSHAWNLGLRHARFLANGRRHVIAVLNDDIVLPNGWFEVLEAAVRSTGATIAHVDPAGGWAPVPVYSINYSAKQVPLSTRLTGWAFMVDGLRDIEADEQFQWWYGDDDLDWRARQMSGVVRVDYWPVTHLDADGSTNRSPALQAIAGEDRERFRRKWGTTPW